VSSSLEAAKVSVLLCFIHVRTPPVSVYSHQLPISVLSCTSHTLPARFVVSGVLKGFDQLLNMVLDESVETLRGMSF